MRKNEKSQQGNPISITPGNKKLFEHIPQLSKSTTSTHVNMYSDYMQAMDIANEIFSDPDMSDSIRPAEYGPTYPTPYLIAKTSADIGHVSDLMLSYVDTMDSGNTDDIYTALGAVSYIADRGVNVIRSLTINQMNTMSYQAAITCLYDALCRAKEFVAMLVVKNDEPLTDSIKEEYIDKLTDAFKKAMDMAHESSCAYLANDLSSPMYYSAHSSVHLTGVYGFADSHDLQGYKLNQGNDNDIYIINEMKSAAACMQCAAICTSNMYHLVMNIIIRAFSGPNIVNHAINECMAYIDAAAVFLNYHERITSIIKFFHDRESDYKESDAYKHIMDMKCEAVKIGKDIDKKRLYSDDDYDDYRYF